MNNTLIDNIEHIGISHMSLEIDPGDILIKEETTTGKKLAIYLVQRFYNEILNGLEENDPNLTNTKFKIRALAYAKWYATKRITELPDVVDNATGWLLKDANETGWFNDLPGEFETLEEFLSTLYEEVPEGSSSYSNWVFITKELLPLAKTMGIPANLILSASNNVRKIRGMVPAARDVMEKLDKGMIKESEAKKDLTNFLRSCANPDISYRQFKEKLDEYRGIVPEITTLNGNIIPTGPEQFMLIIEVQDRRNLKLIENALKHRVDFRWRDISYLLQRLFPQPHGTKDPASKISEAVQNILGGILGNKR